MAAMGITAAVTVNIIITNYKKGGCMEGIAQPRINNPSSRHTTARHLKRARTGHFLVRVTVEAVTNTYIRFRYFMKANKNPQTQWNDGLAGSAFWWD